MIGYRIALLIPLVLFGNLPQGMCEGVTSASAAVLPPELQQMIDVESYRKALDPQDALLAEELAREAARVLRNYAANSEQTTRAGEIALRMWTRDMSLNAWHFVEMNQGTTATALRSAKKAHAMEPSNWHHLDTLGWVYVRMGQADDALKVFDRCAELQEPAEKVAIGRAAAREKKNDAKGAWEELLKASRAGKPTRLAVELVEHLKAANPPTNGDMQTVMDWAAGYQVGSR